MAGGDADVAVFGGIVLYLIRILKMSSTHHGQRPNVPHDIKRNKSVILLTVLCKRLLFGKIFFSEHAASSVTSTCLSTT